MQKVHYIAKSHLVFRSRKKLESAAEMALRPAVTDCVDREKKPNRDENNALKRRLPSPPRPPSYSSAHGHNSSLIYRFTPQWEMKTAATSENRHSVFARFWQSASGDADYRREGVRC